MSKFINSYPILAIAILLMVVVINLDIAVVNLAVPTIASRFHSNMATIQWVLNAYNIMGAVALVFGGRFSDLFGNKVVFFIGVSCFTLASLGCALSINSGMLISFRFLQGVGMGIAFPLCAVIMFTVFPEDKKALAVGLITGAAGITQALGPSLGGILLQVLGWHWIFYLNIPFGMVSIIMLAIFYRPQLITKKESIDYIGGTLLILCLLSGLYAFIHLAKTLSITPSFFYFISISIASFFLLFWRERKFQHPFIDFKLFANSGYRLIIEIRFIVNILFFGILFIMPLYFQTVLGYTPFQSGLILFSFTIFLAVLSPFIGNFYQKYGPIKLLSIGLALFCIGLIIFSFLSPHLVVLIIGLAILGIAVAMLIAPCSTYAMSIVERSQLGMATGLYYSISFIATSFGVAVTGVLIALISSHYLQQHISLNTLTPDLRNHLLNMSHGLYGAKKFLTSQQLQLAIMSFLYSFRIVMFVFLGVAIFGLLLVLRLFQLQRGKTIL